MVNEQDVILDGVWLFPGASQSVNSTGARASVENVGARLGSGNCFWNTPSMKIKVTHYFEVISAWCH